MAQHSQGLRPSNISICRQEIIMAKKQTMATPCPISDIAKIVGRKWTLELVYHLGTHSTFNSLKAAMDNLNPATLTQRLRQLEADGLVSRTIVSTAPIHISYQLTKKGAALKPVIKALYSWTERYV
ncbi:MAG: hypothetical protein RLY92_522 [Chloroflexota bacterium]